MASQYIIIKKYKDSDGEIFYKVNDIFNKDEFYVSVSPQRSIIRFYESNNLEDAVKTINYSNANKSFDCVIEGHDPNTLLRVCISIYKAAKNNYLTDDLSYVSGG